MNSRLSSNKGVILFMVLSVILAVSLLSLAIVSLISSHSRITHHQVSRLQAQYAAQGAINYAYDMMRVGNASWIPTAGQSVNITFCRPGAGPGAGNCDITENDLPSSINNITLSIGPPDQGPSNTTPINATVDYTYTP